MVREFFEYIIGVTNIKKRLTKFYKMVGGILMQKNSPKEENFI